MEMKTLLSVIMAAALLAAREADGSLGNVTE